MNRLFPLLLTFACSAGPPRIDEPATVPPESPAPVDSDEPWQGSLDVHDTESSPPTGDPGDAGPYPIVLAHGFFGFDTFAGTDFLTYFWEVVDHLSEAGETQVFTPEVDPFSNSTLRGDELLGHVLEVLEITGADKVNLIGHSQGGLDARRVATLRPDLVASVTTIATPHAGTSVADIGTGALSFPGAQGVTDALVAAIAGPLWNASTSSTRLSASLEQLSSDGMATFNAQHPAEPTIPYFSIGGRSGRHAGGADCEVASGRPPAFIRRWQHDRDPIDPLLALTEGILSGRPLRDDPNDGLVTVASSRFGEFLGCIPADHFDEIGHLFGNTGSALNRFDHLVFYTELVGWLRARGL